MGGGSSGTPLYVLLGNAGGYGVNNLDGITQAFSLYIAPLTNVNTITSSAVLNTVMMDNGTGLKLGNNAANSHHPSISPIEDRLRALHLRMI